MSSTSRLRHTIRVLSRWLGQQIGYYRHETQRLEIAWTAATRHSMVDAALAASPREGAVVAFCRWSTGGSRRTVIIVNALEPQPGDLSYHRGGVVTVTAKYWNRAIDSLPDMGFGTGLAVLHTHPGRGVPEWSQDDNRADSELGNFLFGEKFLPPDVPLVSIVASFSAIRARVMKLGDQGDDVVSMTSVERIRTLSPSRILIESTADRFKAARFREVPVHADRSVRIFGRDGQRLLADLHVAVVGAGGVGSICAEQIARWGIGEISVWDPDAVNDVNVNRSAIITFRDAKRRRYKAERVAQAIPGLSLVRDIRVRWRKSDIRHRSGLDELLDADLILMLVDDPRPRHFVNRVAYAHFIPVLDGGNAVRSSAEGDPTMAVGIVEGGGVRISHLTPGGACLWCAGHLTAERLAVASRPHYDVAADRARGYIEGLGPEHAPSVMPVNSMTAAMLEIRLQDLIYGLTERPVPEIYFDLLGGTLDELPRSRIASCRQCAKWEGRGDGAELPFLE